MFERVSILCRTAVSIFAHRLGVAEHLDTERVVSVSAREEAEIQAVADYRAHVGKVVYIKRLTAYPDNALDSVDLVLDPPLPVIVKTTALENIRRWMDHEYLDPIWDIEPLNPLDPQLQGFHVYDVYAKSYRLTA